MTTTFGDDVAFLEKNGKIITLSGEGDAKIALSAEYQGRVMTSGLGAGGSGSSSGSAPSQDTLEKYSQCIQDANGDNSKIRKCADLLTP